jgi:hypothetical protein
MRFYKFIYSSFVLWQSRQSREGVLYVKSADASRLDPLFERLLMYTLGDDLTEYGVRIRKGDTVDNVREGLKRLHPGVNPAKMLIEGAEMADEDDVTEWATRSGSSPLKVKWTLDTPIQKVYHR